MHGARSLSIGEDRLRIAPWRGDPRTAHVVARHGRPSTWALACCVEQLVDRGYDAVLTAALPPAEHAPYLANGFTIHERLHLLSRRVEPVPEGAEEHPGQIELHRGRRRDRRDVLAVDAAAFPPFWRLDGPGLDDALGATPSVRYRVARRSAPTEEVLGYAVTGRAGPRGYLQRLAVHPEAQRSGIASALVADALRWLRRWGAREVLVNTQEDNGAALALYERLGFRRHDEGLAVLRRPLDRPAS